MSPAWQFLGRWDPDPVVLAAVGLAAAGYLWGARTVSRRHPQQPWPRRATGLFLAALVLALLVTVGPIGASDDDLFWAHMVQHIVLTMLVAPLLVLGDPLVLLLRVLSREDRRPVVRVLRSRTVAWLTHPAVSWVVFAAVLLGTHATGFYEYALEHPVVHRFVEHPLFVTAALLYFYPLLGTGPGLRRVPPFARVVSLFLLMLPSTVLGFAFYTAGSVAYPWYARVADRPFGPSTALDDQRLAGALEWSSGMVIDAAWIALAVLAWFAAEEARSRRVDAQLRRDPAAG